MCGICGLFDTQNTLSAIGPMNHIQRHRGPDDEGFLFINTENGDLCAAGGPSTPETLPLPPCEAIDKNKFDMVLANRRLAIIDLSPAAHMPMPYRRGRLWLTHNGEIYNFRELRSQLEEKGYTFTSDSDTEVILASYEEWGAECLSRFNGMFSFALWDAARRRLFCARDRFGIKPFYYFWNGNTFIFASEIKSLLQHPLVPRQPFDQAIFDYLVTGRSDHNEHTFFQDIRELPAAHFLIFEPPARRLEITRWWDLTVNPQIGEPLNGKSEEIYRKFAHLLQDAIRLRLHSDVPVGSCLSGGLDSSSVVSLANRLLLEEKVIPAHLVGDHQKTFTARNSEKEIDEYRYSHLIVEQTNAEENLIVPQGEKLWREIGSFVWHMDEPVDSTSQYPQWNVMRLAREHGVPVLLDGQGGDELLAGYYAYLPRYLNQIRQQQGVLSAARAAWHVCKVGGAPAVNVLVPDTLHRMPWRVQKAFSYLWRPRPLPGGGGSGLAEWQISPEFMKRFWDRRWRPEGAVDADGLAGILFRDVTTTNLPKLLRYEDRNGMAFSLEARLPFLDYRLVELAFSLPLNFRIYNGWSKWILRQAMKDVLPAEIVWRRSKMGFPVPEAKWLRIGAPLIREVLQTHDNEQFAPYFQADALQKICQQPDDRLGETPGLWRIINLILWMEIFINGQEKEFGDFCR